MTPSGKSADTSKYTVGYCKPPVHSRFRKGQSGNPGGRPRGMTQGKATALALKEAYRPVIVREGDRVITLPAIQAILRSQVALAAKGNGPAQRAIIEAVQAIERDIAEQTAVAKAAAPARNAMSELEIARRIAFALEKGARAAKAAKESST
jgi:Family of unknown function (DUF5681)